MAMGQTEAVVNDVATDAGRLLEKPCPVRLRPAQIGDAETCGKICFEAFREIATRHGFPPDFPDAQAATGLFVGMLQTPGIEVVVAERDGVIVASNALWAQTPVAGVGPITVAPTSQNASLGRILMDWALARADALDAIGVRLAQAAYHGRSLALYNKLGFDAREPLAVLQGAPVRTTLPYRTVRPAETEDFPACVELHLRLHGYSRGGELQAAMSSGVARVVERAGRVTGYTTGVGFLGHSVGVSVEDVQALIADASAFPGPGFLAPMRDAVLLRWCLEHGLRIVMPMTLMTRGFYRTPAGSYLPSVLF